MLREFRNTSIASFIVELHPDVESYIEETAKGINPIFPSETGRSIYLSADPLRHIEDFLIRPVTDARELENAAKREGLMKLL
jgi:hypothetical protein